MARCVACGEEKLIFHQCPPGSFGSLCPAVDRLAQRLGQTRFLKALDVALFAACPECGERFAMERTGQTENRGFWKFPFLESRCTFCDHRTWEEDNIA